MKLEVKYYSFFCLCALCLQINISLAADKNVLPLDCSTIVSFEERLCLVQTDSAYGPYDDVVFYRLDKAGNAVFLSSQSGGVATFAGLGFSTGGKYMWVSWAEEGHPHFEFYLSRDFLTNGTHANVLKVLGDYYFEDFKQFSDSGEVVYALTIDAFENCADAGEGARESKSLNNSEIYCIKSFNLHRDSIQKH